MIVSRYVYVKPQQLIVTHVSSTGPRSSTVIKKCLSFVLCIQDIWVSAGIRSCSSEVDSSRLGAATFDEHFASRGVDGAV